MILNLESSIETTEIQEAATRLKVFWSRRTEKFNSRKTKRVLCQAMMILMRSRVVRTHKMRKQRS